MSHLDDLVTEAAAGLLAIKSADTIDLNWRVDAAVDTFLMRAVASDKASARQKLAAAFSCICLNSKLSMRIKIRILHS
jgi:hypothetical protein